jgi:hypothetical protein
MKLNLLIKLLCIITLLQISNCGDNLIKKVIKNILKAVPSLKLDIEKSISSQTTTISKVINGGFTHFKQSADIQHFVGVHDDNLDGFLKHIQSVLNIPEVYEDDFIDNLKLIEFSDFNEIIIYRIVFTSDAGGNCKYVCIMCQRNEKTGESEWLIANIKATFMLAPDVMVIETSKSLVFGLYKEYKQSLVSVPKSINADEVTVLVKFFEILVFERFAEILKISDKGLRFLE